MLVHREQQGGYDIAVTVWPPEPKTGLLVFTVLIQAVAATNGGDEAHLAPISSDLTFAVKGLPMRRWDPSSLRPCCRDSATSTSAFPWVRKGSGRSRSTSPDPWET